MGDARKGLRKSILKGNIDENETENIDPNPKPRVSFATHITMKMFKDMSNESGLLKDASVPADDMSRMRGKNDLNLIVVPLAEDKFTALKPDKQNSDVSDMSLSACELSNCVVAEQHSSSDMSISQQATIQCPETNSSIDLSQSYEKYDDSEELSDCRVTSQNLSSEMSISKVQFPQNNSSMDLSSESIIGSETQKEMFNITLHDMSVSEICLHNSQNNSSMDLSLEDTLLSSQREDLETAKPCSPDTPQNDDQDSIADSCYNKEESSDFHNETGCSSSSETLYFESPSFNISQTLIFTASIEGMTLQDFSPKVRQRLEIKLNEFITEKETELENLKVNCRKRKLESITKRENELLVLIESILEMCNSNELLNTPDSNNCESEQGISSANNYLPEKEQSLAKEANDLNENVPDERYHRSPPMIYVSSGELTRRKRIFVMDFFYNEIMRVVLYFSNGLVVKAFVHVFESIPLPFPSQSILNFASVMKYHLEESYVPSWMNNSLSFVYKTLVDVQKPFIELSLDIMDVAEQYGVSVEYDNCNIMIEIKYLHVEFELLFSVCFLLPLQKLTECYHASKILYEINDTFGNANETKISSLIDSVPNGPKLFTRITECLSTNFNTLVST